MEVYTMVSSYHQRLAGIKEQDQTIAFVPTMGALHNGHLELMKTARRQADLVVASIFVNPTQFNEESDLVNYPKPLEQDIHLLEKSAVDILFLPTTTEVYPPGIDLSLDLQFGKLTTVMEAEHRPGHFEGVVMVVHRLLDIIQPDFLIMGQKDLQQMTIIQSMIQQLDLSVALVGHHIVREASGLARSSRNTRISDELRPTAPILFKTLQWAHESKPRLSPEEITTTAMQRLKEAGFVPEYFTIADADSLMPIQHWHETDKPVACVAAWLGDVRLIDNMRLYEAGGDA